MEITETHLNAIQEVAAAMDNVRYFSHIEKIEVARQVG